MSDAQTPTPKATNATLTKSPQEVLYEKIQQIENVKTQEVVGKAYDALKEALKNHKVNYELIEYIVAYGEREVRFKDSRDKGKQALALALCMCEDPDFYGSLESARFLEGAVAALEDKNPVVTTDMSAKEAAKTRRSCTAADKLREKKQPIDIEGILEWMQKDPAVEQKMKAAAPSPCLG